jgi:hypothetical protein
VYMCVSHFAPISWHISRTVSEYPCQFQLFYAKVPRF